MIHPMTIALGLGLMLVAIIGVAVGAPAWLVAVNIAGAAWAFLTVPLTRPHEEGNVAVAWPAILAIVFIVVGLAATVARAPAWLTVMAFAVAVLSAVIAAGAMPGGFERYRRARHP
jgi:hypothetical protein